MRGCAWNSTQVRATKSRTNVTKQTSHQSIDVHRCRHVTHAEHNPQKQCTSFLDSAAELAQRRGVEAAVAAAVLLSCGSGALPSPTIAATLEPENTTPVASKSIDRVPLLRFKHSCLPQLPASADPYDGNSDYSTRIGYEAQNTQVGRRLQERFRVSPPVCTSKGRGDIVVRPEGFKPSLPPPRFATHKAPALTQTLAAPLPVATLPNVMFLLSEDASSEIVASEKYVPSPMEMGWQIYVGSAVATFPFVLGAYEFGKRILIQRRCEKCKGIGLVKNKKGTALLKCQECGGFFPWLGWKTFFTSTAAPGNGGPLLQPKGQTSVFYTVPPVPDASSKASGPEGSSDTGSSSSEDQSARSSSKS